MVGIMDPACGDGRLLASLELQARLENVRSTFWLSYPVGDRALEHLRTLFDYPRGHRPPCCTLYGETNSGKSQIALKFERDQRPEKQTEGEQAVMPVVLVQNPPFGDLRTFYTRTLSRVGVPHIPSSRMDRLLDQLLSQLTCLGTRMLIVDEIQHILAGKVDQRAMFMNSLKYLSNELQIPIVAIGPIGALRTLYTDPQLANRFESYAIPRWQPDAEYAEFLTRLAAQMKLEKPSEFKSKAIVTRVHAMTEGLIGETRKLIGRAAEAAILSGREVIDAETLEAVEWVRPGERRKG